MKTVAEYIEDIDRMYIECRKERLSRMDLKWGKWSAEMNREIRKRIEEQDDPDNVRLKYVFIYWNLRSRLLEVYYKHRLGKNSLKKKLGKQLEQTREFIFEIPLGKLREISTDEMRKIILEGMEL